MSHCFTEARRQSTHKESGRAIQRILFVVSLVFGFSFNPAHAATGFDYLSAQQNSDGSLSNTATSLVTPVQATAETLRAYQALGQQNQPAYAPALGYLNGDPEANTEFLARKIVVNAQAGNNTATFINELLTHQNSDGGFGDLSGYDSAVFDTAYALEALAVARYSSAQSVPAAVGYLLNQQNANGGWAVGDNDPSVFVTAQAMRALWYYRNQYTQVPAALNKARDFLLSQRDGSGSWGEDFDTALALLALVPNLPDTSSVTNSINSLQTAQLSNGSWDNDPYTTALALRALALVSQPQTNPDYAAITGKVVDAQTGLPLSGVTVALSGAASALLVTQSDGVFLFQKLPAGSFSLNIALTNYTGLSVSTAAKIGQTVDLGVLALVKPQSTSTGTVQGVVTDGDTGLPLAGVSVSVSGVAVPALTNVAGAYQINNITPGAITVSASLNGYATATGTANLVSGGILIFSPVLPPVSSGTPTTAVEGTVTDGSTGAPLAGVSVSVTGASVASASTDSQGRYRIEGLTPGSVTLTASLSGYDMATAGTTLYSGSTLMFSPKLYPSSTTPPTANTAGVTGVVLDAGTNAPLSGVSIVVTSGTLTRTLTSDAQGRFTVDGLTASQVNLRFAFSGYIGVETYVALQPLATIDMGQIRLRQAQADTLMPDLTVTAVQPSMVTDPKTLAVSGTLAAVIANVGTTNSAGNVSVLAFYDADHDGSYDAGEPVLGSIVIPSAIAVGANVSVAIPVAGMVPFRDAPISVWVDSEQTIAETNELNNIAATSSACQATSSAQTYTIRTVAGNGSGGYSGDGGPATAAMLNRPHLVLDVQGNLYIADVYNDRIRKVTSDGIITTVAGNGQHGFSGDGGPATAAALAYPFGVALDAQGNLYFVDRNNHRVRKVSPDGIITTVVGNGQAGFSGDGGPATAANLYFPYGLALDVQGNLYIADTINSRVRKVTFNGGNGGGGIIDNVSLQDQGTSASNSTENFESYGSIASNHGYTQVGDWHAGPGNTIEILSQSTYLQDGNTNRVMEVEGQVGGTSVYRDYVTVSGQNYTLSVDYSPRVGYLWDSALNVYWEGQLIGTLDTTTPGLRTYTFNVTAASTTGKSRLEFRARDGVITTVAGNGQYGFSGDGGPATAAALDHPFGLTVDTQGNIYISGNGDPRVRKVTPNGIITTVAGNGQRGFSGDGGPATAAGVNPYGTAVDAQGNLYIADTYNGRVRKVTRDGLITTVAGNGQLGFSGDGGPAMEAGMNPYGLALDDKGNIYIADTDNHRVRRLDPAALATAAPDLTASLLKIIDNGAGQPWSLSVRIGNAGSDASTAGVQTAFYQGGPADGGVLLGTMTLPAITAANYQDIRLDNVTLNGNADVYAVVDSTNIVTECNETNNIDHTPVAATASLGRIAVSTDNLVYDPNTTVQITAMVSNIGSLPANYNAAIQIEDANGVAVTTLPAGSVGLVNGGATMSIPSAWNTGTTLAGNYRVHAFLYTLAGDLLDQATAGFTIRHPDTAGSIASLRVSTDRPVYYTNDLVNIDSLVANLSVSTLIGSANLRITVSDPSGQVVFTNTGILGQLLPSSLRELNFPYALTGAMVAVYHVHGELQDGASAVLASADTQFEVRDDLAKALTGKVSAALSSLEIGTAQTCTDTLTNQGTVAASGIEAHHALLNIDTQQLINDQTTTLNLAPGENNQVARSLATGSLTAGHYACALMVRIGNDLKTLAFAPFEVKIPPIRIDASLDLGAKGRLLVLLDNGRRGEDDDDGYSGDNHKSDTRSCDGVKQFSLSATFSTPLSNAATVTARVTGHDGVFVDAESASLAGFPGALNLSAGSNGADLVLSKLTAQEIGLTLQPVGGAQKLGEEYSVEVSVQDGNTLRLASGTIHTDCSTPLNQGQALGAFTLSALDVVPAANEANYRDTDPHGPMIAPGLKAQRAFLEILLKAKGWSYTITDTAEDFTKELRTGGYTVYAVFAEQEKLDEQVQKELREAVFRGEGLVVAGLHDARHQKLLDALGIKLIGSVPVSGVDLTTGDLDFTGHINLITGDKALRIKRVHADTAGLYTLSAPQVRSGDDDCHDQGSRYDTVAGAETEGDDHSQDKDHKDDDECGGHPERYLDAVTTNAYGQGQSVFAGFDLLATATRDGQDSLAATLIAKALEHVHPAELPRTPGAVVPLTLTLTNRGIATPATATINLPTGTTVIDPGTGTVNASALVFNVNLAVGAQQRLTFWVKLPPPSGPVIFQGVVTAPKLAKPAAIVSYTVTVLQPESLTSIDARLTQLINSGAPNTSALRRAEGYVAKGLKNFFPQLAIPDLLKATDALFGLDDPAVVDIRVALDVWIRWAGQYAF